MTIVVCGYIVGYPLGGMTWHHLNYLIGLAALGHEVWFYEDSGDYYRPYNPVTWTTGDDPTYGLTYLKQTLDSVGLPHQFCYYSQQVDQYFGLNRKEWHSLLKRTDLLICVSGITPFRGEMESVGRTCVIDTDPVFTQLSLESNAEFLRYYRHFDTAATFGKLIGTTACELPTMGLNWVPTQQPISLPHWPVVETTSRAFSTIGKWEYTDRSLNFRGRSYKSSKAVEWLKLVDLPSRTSWHMEMAMSGLPEARQQEFEAQGWRWTDPTLASMSTDAYRCFIQSLAGEFTVAKQIYAGLPSGWFSDRSAAFLASGRPVITQSSGFEQWLPVGEGLFAFSTADEAASALEQIAADPIRHQRAARRLAEEHFDARIVLQDLLDRSL